MKKGYKRNAYVVGHIFALPRSADSASALLIVAQAKSSFVSCSLKPLERIRTMDSIRADDLVADTYFIHGPLGISQGDWLDCGELNGFVQREWIRLEFQEPGLATVIALDPRTLEETGRRPRSTGDEFLPDFGISGSLYIQDVLQGRDVLRVVKDDQEHRSLA